jgi:glutamine amidotransferase-like uncharacterized protein
MSKGLVRTILRGFSPKRLLNSVPAMLSSQSKLDWGKFTIAYATLLSCLIGFFVAGQDWRRRYAILKVPHVTVGVVAFENGDVASTNRLIEVLRSERSFDVRSVRPVVIRSGALREYDVLVFPGGVARQQGEALGAEGRDAVREFLRRGGGYVGICAGAFLAISGNVEALGVIDARSLSGDREIPGWGAVSFSARRSGVVDLQLSSVGREGLEGVPEVIPVHYSGGPILVPAGRQDLPDYVTWATFRNEVWSFEFQRGTMIDTPAIIAGRFGKGRVIAISPHPEATRALDFLVKRTVAIAASDCEKDQVFGKVAM